MKFRSIQIKDLIDEISMGPFGSNIKVECFVDSGVPVLNGSNLTGYALNDNNLRYVTVEKADSLGKANAHRGDVVVTHRGTLGQIVFIPYNSKYDRYIISQSQFRIKCNEKILPEYMVYFFHTTFGQNKLLSNASQVGVPALARATTSFQKLTIDVPDIEDQQTIVDMLETIRSKIDLNNEINQNLNEQVQALFKSWFVDFEPFGGSIPLDWKNVVFADILTPVTEKSNDEKIPMYSVTDTGLFPRDKKFKKKLSMTNAKCKVIHNNDLVFGMSREILNWGVMHEPLGRVSAAYNVYHVSNDVDSFYLEHYIKAHSQYFKDLIRPASREGQGIDKTLLMEKEMYVPSKAILDRYYEIENPIIEFVNSCEEENICLESLRDTLLPRLMSGELNIANIDI